MWGDSESAFKNTSIEHSFNFRGALSEKSWNSKNVGDAFEGKSVDTSNF